MIRRAGLSTTSGLMLIAAFVGLLLMAGNASAIYVDLSGIDPGRNDLSAGGHSLIVISRSAEMNWGDVRSIQMVSIYFDEGPVALDSVVVYFARDNAMLFTNIMGEREILRGDEGIANLDMGGIEGQFMRFTGFGTVYSEGRASTVVGIEFNVSEVGGGIPQPGAAVPEPTAALLFAAGIGVVATRRRG